MAGSKFTMLFNYTSGVGLSEPLSLRAGWSESFYWNTPPTSSLLTAFTALARLRAGLLPNGAYISGVRSQQVDPSSSSQTASVLAYGSTYSEDIPQAALLMRLRSNLANVRTYRIGCIPDIMVTSGEYSPGNAAQGVSYYTQMSLYLAALNNTWFFRASDLTQIPLPLVSVTNAGVFTLVAPANWGANTPFKVRGLKDADNISVPGGIFKTQAAGAGALTGTFKGWNLGNCYNGSMTPYVIVYPQIQCNSNDISRIVVRKVGRPFLGYHGRRSRRRKNVPISPSAVP